MDKQQEAVVSKTAKGIEAVRTGGGLSGPVKSVLKVVDGVKTVSALSQAAGVSSADFQAALKLLHQGGYVQSHTPAVSVSVIDTAEIEEEMLVTLDFTQQAQQHQKRAAQIAAAASKADAGAPAKQATEDARQHEELARQAKAARLKLEADVRQKLMAALQPRIEEELRTKLKPKLEEELRPKLIAALRPGVEAELRTRLEQEIAPRVELELKSRFAKNLAAQSRATEQRVADEQSATVAAAPVSAPPSSGVHERVLASMTAPVFSADATGVCTYMSPAWVQLSGYMAGEALGKPLVEFFAESDRRGLGNMLQGVCKGTAIRFEYSAALQRKDGGGLLWVEVSTAPLYSPSGEVSGVCGVIRDATEARRLADDAETAGVKLLLLVDQIDTGVVVEDRDGNIQQVNPAFCALMSSDAAPASLEGLPVIELLEQVANVFVDHVGYTRRVEEMRANGEDVKGEIIMLADSRMIEQDYLAVIADDQIAGHLWLFREVKRR